MELKKSGDRFFGRACVIGYLAKMESAYPKIGITVSKKFGCAVKRNRFKRLCREVIRENLKSIPKDLSLNFSPRYSKIPASYESIESDLSRMLKDFDKTDT